MRRWRKWEIAFLVLLGIVIVAIVGGVIAIRRGFSAREQPTALEAFVARAARRMAVPASMKNARNPFTATPEVLAEARAHFADHCATCHANNGSGQATIGQNMYPKPPDMRLAQTQQLTDGEIFSIIHNGIRLTGMPAWGEPDPKADQDSWKLVLFIRHLPQLTAQEEKEMEALNPKSPEELQEKQEEQQFLNEQQSSQPAQKQQNRPHH
jgi:mono/diheme cytochrome c family protein